MPTRRSTRRQTRNPDVEATLDAAERAAQSEPSTGGKGKAAPRKGSLEYKLAESFEGIGGMLMLKGDMVCGQAFTQQARPMAEAFNRLAETNSVIKKWLEALTTTTSAGEVFAAVAPILLTIRAHHGQDPMMAQAMGMPDHRPSKFVATMKQRMNKEQEWEDIPPQADAVPDSINPTQADGNGMSPIEPSGTRPLI